MSRQKRQNTSEPDATHLDALAGVGQAILSAQLKLDALCDVVHQQASRIIDTSNFQLGLFDGSDYVIMVWFRDGQRLPAQRFANVADEGLIGWVRRTGQGLLVRDYEKEWEQLPAKPSYHATRPPRSALFAPLIAGGEVIGVITVQSDHPEAFTENDLRLLTVLTSQAAGAIRNAQLFEQAQARSRQLQLVYEVSRQVTAIQPLPDLFKQIVTLTHHTFGYYAVSIFILDDGQTQLQMGASSHEEFEARVPHIQIGQGLVGWAAAHARTVLVPDVTQDERYLAVSALNETRAEVAVPLIIERHVLGVLDVQSDEVGAFTQDDVTVLETLAGQIALAIQEAETYEAERRQRERLNALIEASRAVVSILNIDNLLDEVIDLVTDYFGYDRAHIFLREGDRLIFRAGSGVHSGRWAIERLSYDLDSATGLIVRAARTGQPVISGDVRTFPGYIPGPGVEDTRSEMAIPIRMGRYILGVLDIQSTQPEAFSPEDAELAEALSDTIAIALRNATLYAREKRRRILAESLREVSTVLGASLEMDAVLDGILQGLERVFAFDAALIILYDEDIEAYRVSAARGALSDGGQVGRQIPLDTDLEQAITDIFHPGPNASPMPQHDHLLLPLTLGEETIGYLGIEYLAGRFTPDDIEILNAFATQSAIAIANAQLYMAQREEAWISTALLQVAEATAHETSLDEVLRTVARITPLLAGVEWCGVMLAEGDGFRVIEVEGPDQHLTEILSKVTIRPDDWPPLADLLTHGEPILLSDQTFTIPPGSDNTVHIMQGAMLPLYAKGSIMGALLIGQQDQGTPLSRRKLELISGIANQAATAIETAKLYAAQQEEAWVTTVLLQVAEAVNAQLDLTATLETVTRLIPLLVGVMKCGVLRWDDSKGIFYGGVAYGLPPSAEDEFARIELPGRQHPYLEALSHSTMPLAAGDGTDFDIPPVLHRLFQTPILLGLPLIAQGKLAGIMLVDHPANGRELDQRRMNLLTGIASQTALAIETNHLQAEAAERQRLERELEVARDIQMSFLPERAPAIPHLDVAAYYRAARQVGGDFYDFIHLKDGTWGLVVADVADKGIPAALYMALSRTLLRAVARSRNDPAVTLERVNELLLADTHSDLFVTMWYGIWNPGDQSLFYASAGHNPPLLLQNKAQQIQLLKLKGIALGVLEDISLPTDKIHLAPGDTLIIYTDGITEALAGDGTEFGMNRLENAVRTHARASAQDLVEAVIADLDRFTGAEPPFDDLTLVAARCLPD